MAVRALLERTLAEARASTYLARLGVSVGAVRAGEAQALLRATEASVNRAGMVHGGAIATAMLAAAEAAAASTERERSSSELRVAMLNVSFVDAIRGGTELDAMARVIRRGRDVVHVAAEARATRASAAAQALLVYGVLDPGGPRIDAVLSRVHRSDHTPRERLSASPYMGSAGALLLEGSSDWTCMSLPCAPNEAVEGRVHDGAVVGLVDTCAAMAASERCREHVGGPSATVSISLSWSDTPPGDIRAGARVISRRGSLFSTEAEVWGDDGRTGVSGLICYRIAGAKA
jgi:uncharacterized protein (TIGR00369 family)